MGRDRCSLVSEWGSPGPHLGSPLLLPPRSFGIGLVFLLLITGAQLP